jgi:HEAT repeat protein
VDAAKAFRHALRLQPDDPNAVRALASLNPDAVAAAVAAEAPPEIDLAPLIEALSSGDAGARAQAATDLGASGLPQATSALIPALSDADSAVRCAAALALGRLGQPTAVEPLLPMLEEGAPHERATAAEALGALRDPAGMEPLIEALHDTSAEARRAVALALGSFAARHAIEALLSRLRWDTDPGTRKNAAYALGAIGEVDVVPRLLEAQSDGDPEVREAIRAALARLTGERPSAGAPAARMSQAISEGRYDEAEAQGPKGLAPLMASVDLGDTAAGAALERLATHIGLVAGPPARALANHEELLVSMTARLLTDNVEAVEEAVDRTEFLAQKGDKTGVLALELAYRIRAGQWSARMHVPAERHEADPGARQALKDLAAAGTLHADPAHTQHLLAGVVAGGLPAGLVDSITGSHDGPQHLALKLLLSHLLVNAALVHR